MNTAHHSRREWISQRLQETLQPSVLHVIDQGWQHVGHAEEGAGHFKVIIESSHFKKQTLVECHRLIYEALGAAIGTSIHALQIEIKR